jgi:hypothetical protein
MEQHAGVGVDALLAGAEGAEVLHRARDHGGEELDHDPSLQFAVDANVEEAPRVPQDHLPTRRRLSRGALSATLHRVRRKQALEANFSSASRWRRRERSDAGAVEVGRCKHCGSSNEEAGEVAGE